MYGKILFVAMCGAMVAGHALAADLSAPGGAIPAYFAREIVATPAAPRQLATSASPHTRLDWNVGYSFSDSEVRHVRVEASDNLRFGINTTVTLSGSGVAGSLNGLGTRVLTFSVTSPAGASQAIVHSDTFTLSGDHVVTGTEADVTVLVALYDLPSQAQTGGEAGRVAGSAFSGRYLSFAPSYRLTATATTDVAAVEAVPPYGSFIPRHPVTYTSRAGIGSDGATGISYGLRDPDGAGPQTAPFGVDGEPVTLDELLSPDTTITVRGDFSPTASAGETPFDIFARARTWLVVPASVLTASTATYPVGNMAFANAYLELHRRSGNLIEQSEYFATLNAAAADPTVYAVSDIHGVRLGEIVRNGTQLQAPLAQLPEGWLSRLVLTNTGDTGHAYTIRVLGERGNTIDTDRLTGMVPARGTVVIEDLDKVLTGFTGRSRATLDVAVAGPGSHVQGLYQIVNPGKGSISNHVLVRPGTN